MTDREKVLDALRQIDPSRLNDYESWLAVGMALKDSGCSVEDWDSWSRRDTRSGKYHPGECVRKWASFRRSGIGTGTLFKLCLDQGGHIARESRSVSVKPLDWDAELDGDEDAAISAEWTESHGMPPPPDPQKWSAITDLKRYIKTLFQPEEYIGYVSESWKTESGQTLPTKGVYIRTAQELLNDLDHYTDLRDVVGDWAPEVGAWIRFNPLDGKGIQDLNITSFRFALVESDSLPIDRQYDLYRQMELPVAAMVYSGGKSVHAIVRIDAANMDEYRKRVDFLYTTCKKAGLEIDRQNRNPSRLSRMPGAMRDGKRQYLIETNVGKESWQEWQEWIEEANDSLPNMENIADVWNNLPAKADEVIESVLRKGHKMLVAGPSKAGKSFGLIELAIAIAEGKSWMGFNCRQGKTLYVNLELDRASGLHRFKEIYEALGWAPSHIQDIDIWNLRGEAMPMDRLAPKLIRRATKRGYLAVIIDPIYKVITGDENSASEMANFCNQFDRICKQLATATIYCHHHSKGNQGQKNASDRASGSGVFARDPDACLDIIELNLDKTRREVICERSACDVVAACLDKALPSWRSSIPQDDALVWPKLQGWLTAELPDFAKDALKAGWDAFNAAKDMTAWRIEGTLREFKGFAPKRVFFKHPVHFLDSNGLLDGARADGEWPVKSAADKEEREKAIAKKKEASKNETIEAFEAIEEDGRCKVSELAQSLGIGDKGLRKRLEKIKTLTIENGLIFRSSQDGTREPEHTSKVPVSKQEEGT